MARLRFATQLRRDGISARADLGKRRLARQLEQASREGAHFAVILGDELREGMVQLRDLRAASQHPVPVTELAREIERGEGSHRHG